MKQEREICPCCNRPMPLKKNIEIVTLFQEGKSVNEIMNLTGKAEKQVRQALAYRGFKPPRKENSRSPLKIARDKIIIDQFKEGKTLDQIKSMVGVTRQRVQQVLARYAPNELGGLQLRSFISVENKKERKEQIIKRKGESVFAKFGLSIEDYDSHVAEYGSTGKHGSPMHRFVQQRRNSKDRGVSFDLTFKEWWQIWLDSGKWDQRGRGNGFVMGRHGDAGSYTSDNVYICTGSQNSADQYASGKQRKVSQRNLDGKCKRGHFFDKVIVLKNGSTCRICTECQRIREKKHNDKRALLKLKEQS